jgi:hypothetical protein
MSSASLNHEQRRPKNPPPNQHRLEFAASKPQACEANSENNRRSRLFRNL